MLLNAYPKFSNGKDYKRFYENPYEFDEYVIDDYCVFHPLKPNKDCISCFVANERDKIEKLYTSKKDEVDFLNELNKDHWRECHEA